jgi:hypothetical protein
MPGDDGGGGPPATGAEGCSRTSRCSGPRLHPGQHRAGVRDRRSRLVGPRSRPTPTQSRPGGSWLRGRPWSRVGRTSSAIAPWHAGGGARPRSDRRHVAQHRPVTRQFAASRPLEFRDPELPRGTVGGAARLRRPSAAPCRGGRCRRRSDRRPVPRRRGGCRCHGPCGRHSATRPSVTASCRPSSKARAAPPARHRTLRLRRRRLPTRAPRPVRGGSRTPPHPRPWDEAPDGTGALFVDAGTPLPLARRVPVRLRGSAQDRPRPGSAADRIPRALTRP